MQEELTPKEALEQLTDEQFVRAGLKSMFLHNVAKAVKKAAENSQAATANNEQPHQSPSTPSLP